MNKQPFPFADLNKVIALVALTLVIGLVTNAWALSLPFTKTVETTATVNSYVADPNQPLTEGWQTYQDNNLNIAFEYPAQWSVTKGSVIYDKNTGETIGIKKPRLTNTGYPQDPLPSIYIEIFNASSDSTDVLQTYEMIKHFSPDVVQSVHLKSQSNVSGASALEYCGLPGLFSYCETMFLKEGKLYIIGMVEGIVVEDLYNHVVSSFKFSDSSIADWETYTNEKYHFSFRYPIDAQLAEFHLQNDIPISSEGVSLQINDQYFYVCPENQGNDCIPFQDGRWDHQDREISIAGQSAIERMNTIAADQNCPTCTPTKEINFVNRPKDWTGSVNFSENRDILLRADNNGQFNLVNQILSTFKFTN